MVAKASARLQSGLPTEWSAPQRAEPQRAEPHRWEPQRWDRQRTALTSLANVWLAEGASAVVISIDGVVVVALSAAGAPAVSGHDRAGLAQLTAPIYWQGQPVGDIRIIGALDKAARGRAAAEAELVGLLLESEADLSSVTDQLIETQDQLLAVYDLGQLARRPMRLAERLSALAEAAGRLLDVEGAAIIAPVDGTGPAPAVVAAQYPPEAQAESWLLSLLTYLPARGASGDGAAEQPVLWQGRHRSDDGRHRRTDETRPAMLPQHVNSLLMVPLSTPSGGEARGAFVFWSQQHERFASPDTKLATAIAQHASVQLENALLQRDRVAQARLETEMQLARRVQTDLLPKTLPRLPGLDLYACTRPASHVGGDFFDFVAPVGGAATGDSTVFLVSDVSGKGMSAALVMTMTRTILRSVVGQAAHYGARASAALASAHSRTAHENAAAAAELLRPAALLALVNNELFHDLTELSMFATAFVAQYHHPSRRLVYSNAGHSPVIYMPAGSPPQLLEACCPPIGVLPDLTYGDRSVTLGPGDILVAASDGFNETLNAAGEMFGLERLLRCVADGAHLSAADMGRSLFAAVEAFRAGEMQEDDQTLVIAKGA